MDRFAGLVAHERGVRMEAQHMCPDCGGRPLLYCRWCQLTGVVTEQQLAEWVQNQNLVNR